ncbi:putative RNA methyltransferase [Shewanella aestuarii]|uniref:SAM-dependent methyltransferase n=1 Tax=Shewanella aestuarii TaxID=1028752 RepID=A0A6G9QL30_9GAMM|nr:SAM-dependent methyltransferase [Shewanella aestuarii]QIR15280.1 SAM-dependent methyltransferase [Shewanella aestuarii]
MSLPLVCPVCQSALHQHQASKGFYCDAKHHFDKLEQGYYPLIKVKAKTPQSSISRQQMRSRQFLLQSGVFSPLVNCLQKVICQLFTDKKADRIDGEHQLNWLDYQCADGYYLRQIYQSLAENGLDKSLSVYGVSDAENALFAASKAGTPADLLYSSMKVLPFANHSIDLITLFDAPFKGQECIRVLKQDGRIILVQPTNQHLWQIKQKVYSDLTVKPTQLNIPKKLKVVTQKQVSFTLDVTGEQALSLLDNSQFAWRANDEIRHQIKATAIDGLRCEFEVLVLGLTD